MTKHIRMQTKISVSLLMRIILNKLDFKYSINKYVNYI